MRLVILVIFCGNFAAFLLADAMADPRQRYFEDVRKAGRLRDAGFMQKSLQEIREHETEGDFVAESN